MVTRLLAVGALTLTLAGAVHGQSCERLRNGSPRRKCWVKERRAPFDAGFSSNDRLPLGNARGGRHGPDRRHWDVDAS
jgi:hypothetical protein